MALESPPLAHQVAARLKLLSEYTKMCAPPPEILVHKGDMGFLLHWKFGGKAGPSPDTPFTRISTSISTGQGGTPLSLTVKLQTIQKDRMENTDHIVSHPSAVLG